ncbi:MAG: hypothetical protein F6K65_09095 [Moorea sp. SIO3C2]|nr:hypothetical protein [Moorena sp. SIO3C2]
MANLIRQRKKHHYGLGEPVPPKGVPPMSNWRGFPHSRFAWLTGQLGHDKSLTPFVSDAAPPKGVSPTRALHQEAQEFDF